MMQCILYSCLLIGVVVDSSLVPSSSTSIVHKSVGQYHSSHDRNVNRQLYSTITKSSSLGWNLDRIHSIRGGSADSDDEYSDDAEDSEEEEEEDMSESELSDLEVDTDEGDEDDDEDVAPSSSSSSLPVKLTISTNLQSSLLDQTLDFTASRKRTVLSLKQAVSKTMRGRPPLSSVILKFSGRLLEDDEIVDDIVAEVEEDDDDDSDVEDDDDDGMIRLKLTCDIVPPVDAKFGIEFREKATQMSTKELLDAYCVNMAGMVYNSELQQQEAAAMQSDIEGDEDDEDNVEAPIGGQQSQNHALNIRKRAASIQKQMEQSLSGNVLELMEQEHERVQAHVKGSDGAVDTGDSEKVIYGLVSQDSSSSRRSGRKGKTLKGGATMNIKRSLQRNMNVNWADTTRNSLLFLFFGYFGGRNSFSRTFLLLSSPLCFLIQTRPMKVAMKQLFYTMGEPPGILLSLLPAPQQAIMSLDYGKSMRELYDEKVLQKEAWFEMEEKAVSDDSDSEVWGDDDDYDEDYDDETDGEY